MKLSDYIVKYFEEQGTMYIFGFIGGAITHIVDSISKSKKVKFIQVYHEQTASFAAEGYSRNSSKIGVAIATSGPGATNLITGIGDAYFDSIPVIFITGQVNTYEYKYDKPVRQQGFQETDIASVVKPITKYAVLIDNPNNIRYELEKCFFLAKVGRPGPVLIDIPMDIQRAEINTKVLKKYTDNENIFSNEKQFTKINNISEVIKKSKRPIFLAGGGIRNSHAEETLYKCVEDYKIPVVTSLMGKGCFSENHDLFVGMIGTYGNRSANIVLANSDLLIAIGSRLDTRQTGSMLNGFLRQGKIIHVDIDKNEINYHRLKRDYKISLDAKMFLTDLNTTLKDYKSDNDWLDYIKKIKNNFSQEREIERNIKNKMLLLIRQFIHHSSFYSNFAPYCRRISLLSSDKSLSECRFLKEHPWKNRPGIFKRKTRKFIDNALA